MNVTQPGINLIEEFEGFPYNGRPYWDPYGQVWTRGFGETDGITKDSPPETLKQAEARLKKLLKEEYMPPVDALAHEIGGFNEYEYDTLGSIVWNLGTGIIGPDHDLGRLLRAHDFDGFAQALLAYDHAGGIVLPGLDRRRHAEASMFRHQVNPLTGLTVSERRWCNQYDRLLRAHTDPDRRRVLQRVMTEDRKRIFHIAHQPNNGWDAHHRRERYHALLARTT